MQKEQDLVKIANRLVFEYRSLAVIYLVSGIAMLLSSTGDIRMRILAVPGIVAFAIGALALIFIARISGNIPRSKDG